MKTIQRIDGCCASLTAAPIDKRTANQIAIAFKALADPVRVRIVSMIGASPSGELCGCDFPAVLGLSQPTVSHHLKLLTQAGILDREQRGKWAHFRVAPGAFDTLRTLLTVPAPR